METRAQEMFTDQHTAKTNTLQQGVRSGSGWEVVGGGKRTHRPNSIKLPFVSEVG